jgi:hypothetical protein
VRRNGANLFFLSFCGVFPLAVEHDESKGKGNVLVQFGMVGTWKTKNRSFVAGLFPSQTVSMIDRRVILGSDGLIPSFKKFACHWMSVLSIMDSTELIDSSCYDRRKTDVQSLAETAVEPSTVGDGSK